MRRPTEQRATRRRAALGAVLAVALLATTGCQGLYGVALPGGAATGDHVYRVTAVFRDVMDLVPQSAVKVDDVTVGSVERIDLDGWQARVVLRLEDSVHLPDNAVAELRQTSLLGEKYVELAAPQGVPPTGRLGDGDVIPVSRSDRTPEVEEVLGALSLLLNGGGVAQLKTINVELAKAMHGREGDLRDVVSQLDTFIGGLDSQKAEITRALDALDRLSGRLAAQRQTIATAVDEIGPGLKVLADQRAQLTTMLTELSRLGEVGTRVIKASKDDTVADLRALQPTLTKLAEAGDDLPNALELLLTYPFPRNATSAVRGDYTNLKVTADLDLQQILGNLGGPTGLPTLPTTAPTHVPTTLPTTLPSLPTTLPSLPTTLPSLPTTLPSLRLPSGCPTPGSTPTAGVPSVPLPSGCPTPTPGSTSGGGLLCPPVCALGAEPRIDENLAELMIGGWL